MKKKLILIFVCTLAFATLSIVGYMHLMTYVVFATDPKYTRMANNHSKIEYFIDMKKDDNYIVVSEDALVGNYYIDFDDSLYLSIKTTEYAEVDKPTDYEFLYKIIMVRKIDEGNNANKIDSIGDVTIKVYSKNIISVYAYIDADLNSTSNTRYYQLSDNDYNQLINNVISIIENGVLYKSA